LARHYLRCRAARTTAAKARELIALAAPLALDLFLELVALGFLLDQARTIAELGLPLAPPGGPDTVLALDLALVFTRLGFGLYFARTTPEVLPDLTATRRPKWRAATGYDMY
jgi:hypothetical protein